jgi:cytochrome c biogenesis protein CcdA
METQSLAIIISVVISIIGVLIYLGLHIFGVIRLARSQDTEAISRLSIAAWVLSFVSGFMGPCVIPINLAAIVMAAVALRGNPTDRSRICAQTAIAVGVTIVLMTLGMVAALVPYIVG